MEFLFEQAYPIPHHALAACAALLIGGVQLVMRKGAHCIGLWDIHG